MDVGSRFLNAVLSAFGWPRKPPPLDFMLFYRAEVQSTSADGSTVDVAPEDGRIGRHQGVPLRTPLPGCTVVVKAGTVVLLGWEKGDPSRIYASPMFESAGGIAKVVVKADAVYIGDESGADSLVTKTEFNAHLHQVSGVTTGTANVNSGVPTSPATGTTKLKAV